MYVYIYIYDVLIHDIFTKQRYICTYMANSMLGRYGGLVFTSCFCVVWLFQDVFSDVSCIIIGKFYD